MRAPLFGLLLLVPAVAHAEPKMACLEEAERAQRTRMDGKLGAARSDLLACSNAACPMVVRRDCERWLDEVEEAMPSIVIEARDEGGESITDVAVSIDGIRIADRLDGRSIFVDRGAHRLSVARPGYASLEQAFEVREREKRRRIDFTFGARSAPEEGKGMRPTTIAGISFLSLGGIGLVLGTALGASAFSSPCARGGMCTMSERDSADRAATVANVSFIVGAVALVTGVVLLVAFKK